MKTIAKMIGHSLIGGVVGMIGVSLAAFILNTFGIEGSLFPLFVGGVWSGEYIHSVINS